MATKNLSILYIFYGLYMIICGIIPLFFLGQAARSAFVSGVVSGGLAFVFAFYLHQGRLWAFFAGNLLAIFLLGIFAFRASASFLRLVDLIAYGDSFQLPEKAVGFLILSSMFLISLIVFCFGVFNARSVLRPPAPPSPSEAPPLADPMKI